MPSAMATPQRAIPLVLLVTLTLTLTLQATQVLGWGCVGHMLVAEIARRRLDEGNAQKLEAMAHSFHESGPFPWSPDMVQAACWADDAKQWHQYAMKPWHFIDLPYNPENITIDDPVDSVNAVTASSNMIAALRNAKAPLYMLNFAWVNLVHFIGDLHQPLHATTLYSHTFPHGDRGGNSIEVKVKGKGVKLHALWDDICAVPAPHYKRPLSETDSFALAATADRLEDTYKFPSTLRHVADPRTMAEESHDVAVNSTYVGVVPGAALDEAYLQRCKEVAEGRIVLGGYRLGYLLNDLLSNITLSETGLAAQQGMARRGALISEAKENKTASWTPRDGKLRFREVLTVERKVYLRERGHGDEGDEEGTMLSREETVRNVTRDRREQGTYWQTDL